MKKEIKEIRVTLALPCWTSLCLHRVLCILLWWLFLLVLFVCFVCLFSHFTHKNNEIMCEDWSSSSMCCAAAK